jgi:ParB family transcriptional regulator, chromosome partitioning protein
MSTSPLTSPAEAFHWLDLDLLVESKTNPRRRYNEQRMADLVASAKQVGIVEPILCRPKGDKKFEIVAGSRRARASRTAGLSKIKAIVSHYTDAQVAEVQLIENGQREDVHPLEDAHAIEHWLKITKGTVEICAEKIGKDASHVYRRLHLLKLIPSLQELFYEDRITTTHALLLARLRPEDQAYAEKEGLFGRPRVEWDPVTKKTTEIKENHAVAVRELASWINQHVLLVLGDAPWELDDPLLVPAAGSCAACPKRTGAQQALFVDLDGKDRCLDRACFESKRLAMLKAAEKETPGLVRIATNYISDKAEKKRYGVTVEYHQVREAKAACKAPRPAIVAFGENFGKRRTICTDQKCKHHGSTPRPVGATSKEDRTKQALEREIEAAVELTMLRRLVGGWPRTSPPGVYELLALIEWMRPYGEARTLAAEIAGVTEAKLDKALPKLKTSKLWPIVLVCAAADEVEGPIRSLLAKARGIDLAKVQKEVETKVRAELEKTPAAAPKTNKGAKRK